MLDPQRAPNPRHSSIAAVERFTTAAREDRARPGQNMGALGFDPKTTDEELMQALVVEDSPQIAERLVELVAGPDRVSVGATPGPADQGLAACQTYTNRL